MRRRQERINDLLEEQISSFLADIIDIPDVLVSVSEVRTSVDLHHAQVLISTLPEIKLPSTLALIKKRAGLIQKELNKKLRMRPVPKLRFVSDKGTLKERSVLEAIQKTEEE